MIRRMSEGGGKRLAGNESGAASSFVTVACDRAAFYQTGFIAAYDHGRMAMPTFWTGHLITDPGNGFAVDLGCRCAFNDDASVIGLVSDENDRAIHLVSLGNLKVVMTQGC